MKANDPAPEDRPGCLQPKPSEASRPLHGRKVLISAYACDPREGSEPGAGAKFVQGWLALGAETTVVTRVNNASAIASFFSREIQSGQLKVQTYDLGPIARRVKNHFLGGVQLYYALWQAGLATILPTLHERERFDIAHHATFAVDWMPAGVSSLERLGVPVIWGPVGGASKPHGPLTKELSIRDRASEVLRRVVGSTGRHLFGKPVSRRVSLTVAQNDDVLRMFARSARHIVSEPNVFVDDHMVVQRRSGDGHSIVGIGRLLGFKGWTLAIRSLSLMPSHYTLTIYGEGQARSRINQTIRKYGMVDRVHLAGWRPRDEIMDHLSRAHCLVHPSFHEGAGLAVAEALSSNCPAVVLDVGGPAVLVRAAGGTAVDPNDPDLASTLASAMEWPAPPSAPQRWSASRLPSLLLDWYELVAPSRDHADAHK